MFSTTRAFAVRCLVGLAAFALAAQVAAQGSELQRVATVLSEGPAWQVVKIEDPESIDPVTRSVTAGEVTELYVVRGVAGILASPMPAGQKEKLAQLAAGSEKSKGETSSEGSDGEALSDGADGDKVFIVHKEIVDEYWQHGVVPERFAGSTRSDCDSWPGVFHEIFDPVIPLQGTFPIERGASTAEVGFSADLHTNLTATIEYRVHTTACIPSSIELDAFDVTAELWLRDASATLDLATEQSWSQTYEKQIANPRVWVLAFAIGPIPVTVSFNLPTKIGVDLEASGAASTSLEMPFDGRFGFIYTCNSRGCRGTQNGSFDTEDPLHDATGDLEINLKAEPFFDSRVRASLYTDRIFYFEVGLRTGLDNWLWGYAGNQCGDDQNGSPAWVQGAFFDSVFDLQVPWGYGGIFGDDERIESIWRRSVYFQDLLPAGTPYNALAPTLEGPRNVGQGDSVEYELDMRPCYPLTEDLSLQLEGGNGGAAAASLPYDLSKGRPVKTRYTFADINNQTLRAINVSDAIGRSIGSYSAQNVWVRPEDIDDGGDPDGPEGPCDPMCPPPTIHDFQVYLDRDGTFADATVTAEWSLGWDIDPNLQVSAAPATKVEVISYYRDHNGDLANVGEDTILSQQFLPSELSNSRRFTGEVTLTDFEALTGHPIPVICLRVDMDDQNVLVPYDLVTFRCVDLVGGTTDLFSHIVVQASVEAGSDDIQVAWTDDSSDGDNFTLYRSLDGGDFELLQSNLDYRTVHDWNVGPGTYRYGVVSNGREYFSNDVTVEAATPQRPIVTWSDPTYYGTEIGTPDGSRGIKVTAHDPTEVASEGGWEGQYSFEDPYSNYWYILGVGGPGDAVRFSKDIEYRRYPRRDLVKPGWNRLHFRYQNRDDWRDVIRSPEYRFYKPDYNLRIRSEGCPTHFKLIWDDERFDEYEVGYSFNGATYSLGFVTDTEIELASDRSFRQLAVRGRGQPWWSNAVNPPCEYEGYSPFTASDHLLDYVLLEWGSVREVEVWRSDTPNPGDARLLGIVSISAGDPREYRDANAPTDVPLYYWLREVGTTGLSDVASGFRPSVVQLDRPDLSPRNLSVAVVNDDRLRVSYEMHNLGTGDAGVFTHDVWLSADSVLDAEDYLHQSQGVLVGLGAGEQTSEIVDDIVVPSHLKGRWVYVFAVADHLSYVDEEDEANNQAVTSIFVP